MPRSKPVIAIFLSFMPERMFMTTTRTETPEFSHTLSIDKIPAAGMEITLEARESERQKLAERFGLIAIDSLCATLTVHLARNDKSITVTGPLKADVVQACVVTLEPLPAKLEKIIETQFVPLDMLEYDNENMEPLDGMVIDLGELAAQHLATALDPYPRKPGLPFVEAEFGESARSANPFAQLKKKPDEN
jgi:hypothetical protein